VTAALLCARVLVAISANSRVVNKSRHNVSDINERPENKAVVPNPN